MRNTDSVLKSRGITLPTKVHTVKSMIFPVIMYRCETDAEAWILWPPDVKGQLIAKDPDARKDWGQEAKRATDDEMIGWHHWLDGCEFEQTPGDSEGQGRLLGCSRWDCKESDKTEWLTPTRGDVEAEETVRTEWPGVCAYEVGEINAFVFQKTWKR